MSAAQWLQSRWFEARLAPLLWLLLPLNFLFVLLSGLRRHLFRLGWLSSGRLPVAVIVVGNITVGGAGKTPLTQWLARELVGRGWRPGIVSRGYGAATALVQPVTADSTPADVGDEPLLLAAVTGLPVWVGRDRVHAGQALLAAHPEVDLILCDDGLQHLRLERDFEIAVFDGRGVGNGWRLPVGPLREPAARLATVDAVVINGQPGGAVPALGQDGKVFSMALVPGNFYRLGAPQHQCRAEDLQGKRLFAVAGIGDPGRFFRTLTGLGLDFEARPFPDHHVYTPSDFAFGGVGVVLMTAKDAVKCVGLTMPEAWVLPVDADVSPALVDLILEKISGRQAS